MTKISEKGLSLLALNLANLQIWQNLGRKAMEQQLGLSSGYEDSPPNFQTENKLALEDFWLPYVAKNSQNYCWYTNWEIILDQDNSCIGSLGFGGLPSDGLPVLGYYVYEKFRRQGWGALAVGMISKWALAQPQVHGILAETNANNQASQKILQKNGFSILKQNADNIIVWQKLKT
jgi:[ribosomal protein S5]-alanine N-acetyltransferase